MTTARAGVATAIMFGALVLAPQAHASDTPFFQWMDNDVTLLTGANYALQGNTVSTLTIDHASGWAWGDLFAFVDYVDLHDHPTRDDSWYGEFSPRFSLGKLAGLGFAEGGLIKDLSVATTWERGENGLESLLIGMGSSLDIPGFNFVNLNLYARKDTSLGAGFDDAQITVSWARPFLLGDEKFVIDGFLDYVIGWGPQAPSLHLVPQVKWDIGPHLGLSKSLYFGTEIDIWHNEYGVRDTPNLNSNQIAVSLLMQVHF